MGDWIGGAVLIGMLVFIAVQVKAGVAVLGLDHSVQREKSAGPFWFVIGVELLAFAVSTILFVMSLTR